MDGSPFTYPPPLYKEPIYAPTPTPISDTMLAPIVQPDPLANAVTNDTSSVIPQLIINM